MMSFSVEFLLLKLGISVGGAYFFICSIIKSVNSQHSCDNNSVNLMHDATVTICCVTELVEHTLSDMTGSVDRKLWYDNDMY